MCSKINYDDTIEHLPCSDDTERKENIKCVYAASMANVNIYASTQ